jgi:salicylate hydroxylase
MGPFAMGERRTIVVAGAGIAGLTAALALNAKGIPVALFERSEKLSEIGAGIQLSPNAGRILAGLGLDNALAAAALEPRSIDIVSGRSGRTLCAIPASEFHSRFGFPYRVIHRADLQSILVKAVERAGIRFELGQSVADYLPQPETLLVRTRKGRGGTAVTSAAAIIGADGVWSTLRQQITGGATPTPSGRTAWRAIISADVARDLVALDRIGLWIGRDAHLVHYPVAQGAAVNVVAIISEAWDKRGWSTPGDAAELTARFAGWSGKARALLSAPVAWQKYALLTVSTAGAWVEDRLALIGDAAHATMPFLAQGAAMAIEDAAVLAEALYGAADFAAALSAYADRRRTRVARIVTATARAGERYHLSGVRALARDAALRFTGRRLIVGQNEWIYGWQPESETPAAAAATEQPAEAATSG